MDFERIDINQCPKGKGNNGPNKFANTARCKMESTEVLNLMLSMKELIYFNSFKKNCSFLS